MRIQDATFERRTADHEGVLFRPSGEFLTIMEPGELRWSYRRNLDEEVLHLDLGADGGTEAQGDGLDLAEAR